MAVEIKKFLSESTITILNSYNIYFHFNTDINW